MELTKRVFNLRSLVKDRIIVDQLSRAVLSIPPNIAEGNGRNTIKEKVQFYKTARGSLFECIPILQLIAELNLISEVEHINNYTTPSFFIFILLLNNLRVTKGR